MQTANALSVVATIPVGSSPIGVAYDGMDKIFVAMLEMHSTDDTINSMTAINTGHYKTIEISSNDGHTTLLESDKTRVYAL